MRTILFVFSSDSLSLKIERLFVSSRSLSFLIRKWICLDHYYRYIWRWISITHMYERLVSMWCLKKSYHILEFYFNIRAKKWEHESHKFTSRCIKIFPSSPLPTHTHLSLAKSINFNLFNSHLIFFYSIWI